MSDSGGTPGFTKEERDELLQKHDEAEDHLIRLGRESYPGAEQEYDEHQEARIAAGKAYLAGLPRTVLSRCPYCGEPLVRMFDPWGPDGFWWQPDRAGNPPAAEACPHFEVLLGAVNLNGLPPRGGRSDALLGPEVPFVVPKVLELPTMVAVVSSIVMENGYTAYPIAYFSETPSPPGGLTIPWARRVFHYHFADGTYAWSDVRQPWDFEVWRWFSRGKVRWIAPADPEFELSDDLVSYPYRKVDGHRAMVIIQEDRLRTEPAPDGSVGAS